MLRLCPLVAVTKDLSFIQSCSSPAVDGSRPRTAATSTATYAIMGALRTSGAGVQCSTLRPRRQGHSLKRRPSLHTR